MIIDLIIISLLHLVSTTLTSTSGVILERAKENVDCCLTQSIFASEDGQSVRWPRVHRDGQCRGGGKLTFQQWIDDTVNYYETDNLGLCVEGWRYVVKGTLIKTNHQYLKLEQQFNSLLRKYSL